MTAFGQNRQVSINDQAEALNGRLLATAIDTFSALQTGKLGLTGATGMPHLHSLLELRALADRSLSEIRLASATTTIAPP